MDTPINLPPLDIQSLLRRYDLKPRKGLGQNFLVDDYALQRIIEAAEIKDDVKILEIGPGLGNLTRYLANYASEVVAVELDSKLIPILEEVLKNQRNVKIIQADILEINLDKVFDESGYYVVANIPYYITSAIIRRLMEARNNPARIVLTIQHEVAERIMAKPGKLSLLALSVQVYGKPSIATRIPAGAFYPRPDVDSAVVRVDNYDEPLIPQKQLTTFFKLAKAGFSQKRKTLRNSLSGGLALDKEQVETLLESANVDPQRRAQTLDLEEWKHLTEKYDAIRN